MKRHLLTTLLLGGALLFHGQGEAMVKGADVSWLTQMEKAGYKFYNDAGQQQDLFKTLKTTSVTSSPRPSGPRRPVSIC